MASHRCSVAQLAREAGLDLDEALIELWDAGFERLTDPSDLVPQGDANRARRALGLATRRELGSIAYWVDAFQLSRAELEVLLADLGAPSPFEGSRVRSRAIHRLRRELRRRMGPSRPERHENASVNAAIESLAWETIGHERELSYLTTQEVRVIHDALVADFADTTDPLNPSGVRSIALLDSALHRPHTGIASSLKYPTVEMAAAALLHGLVHDHPFHNGNKRTALVAMLVFLDENGLVLTCNEESLFKLVLQLAQHALTGGRRDELADREVLAVAKWLKTHSRLMEKGDRAVSWRRLRQILKAYDCRLVPAGGNRINIERPVAARKWFVRQTTHILRTQTHYGDEGREVDKTAINRLRRELELDDEHGIDSATFYDDAAATSSDFIVRYRKTLRRLARL